MTDVIRTKKKHYPFKTLKCAPHTHATTGKVYVSNERMISPDWSVVQLLKLEETLEWLENASSMLYIRNECRLKAL